MTNGGCEHKQKVGTMDKTLLQMRAIWHTIRNYPQLNRAF